MDICLKCGGKAEWYYMPGDELDNYCDSCVPRGCSCNRELKPEIEAFIDFWFDKKVLSIPDEQCYNELINDPNNWIEVLDEQGRLLPCVEFDRL